MEKMGIRTKTPPGAGLGYRHLVTVLMFLSLAIAYGLRVNMSVAIVAMTDVNSTLQFPTYNWTRKEQNIILSSFFWGYVATQIPAAFIGNYFGPHYPLGIAIILCSFGALFTPLLSQYGPYAVEAIRIFQGATQGFCFPSLHHLCSKWIPFEERGRLATFIYAGAQLGTVVFLSLSGVLTASKQLGWPSAFYCTGVIGIVWGVLWMFFGGNSPSEYKYIKEEEIKYIEGSVTADHVVAKRLPTPWLAMLTSRPMWALILVHAANTWSLWTLIIEMPTYMKDILNYDTKQSGWSSSLPYLTMWLLSFVFSFSSDFLTNRQIISVNVSRKLFNTIGTWIPAAALIALGYTENSIIALTLLIIAVGFNSAIYVGLQINHIDLAPNFAGIMMGITNCVANVSAIITPLVVGHVLGNKQATIEGWRTIFHIAAGIYFFGNLIFILFGSTKIQPWNDPLHPTDATAEEEEAAL